VAAHLAPLLHHALVEHERCEEHGELVHSGGEHAHDATVEIAPDHSSEPIGPVAEAPPTERQHAHEHCELIADGRHATLRSDDARFGCDAFLSVTPIRGPTLAAFSPSVPLYATAPKTSPPV
jgi:hypothetical protein